jgi:aryl-alcohol dehydrogenase-like predicted oxidoreductase
MAIERGVTYFDTAEGYGDGHSEEVLGRALEGRRDGVLISSKTKNAEPRELFRSLENSLRHLRTDTIDLYCLHWPNREVPLDITLETLEKAKTQGKVRHIGVCNFGLGDLGAIGATHEVFYNQLPYNLFWRMVEEGVLEDCLRRGIGVAAYSPLAQGLLTGKFRRYEDIPPGHRHNARLFKPVILERLFPVVEKLRDFARAARKPMNQLAIAWVLAHPAVTCTIPGAKNRRQLQENLGAMDIVLSDEQIARLNALTAPLEQELGSDPDMWDNGRFR